MNQIHQRKLGNVFPSIEDCVCNLNEMLFLKTGGHMRSILVKRLLTYQKLPLRDEQRLGTSILSRKNSNFFRMCLIPDRFIEQLIQNMKDLFVKDDLDEPKLKESFNKMFEVFTQKHKIEPIDMIAMLNTIRLHNYTFIFDSKRWFFCFSEETRVTHGRTRMMIKMENSLIFNKIKEMSRLLDQPRKDLVWLMYCDVFKDPRFFIYPRRIENFQLTIETSYDYWCKSIRWDEERKDFLSHCSSVFIRQPFFSAKQSKFASFMPNSFEDFIKQFFSSSIWSCKDEWRKELMEVKVCFVLDFNHH